MDILLFNYAAFPDVYWIFVFTLPIVLVGGFVVATTRKGREKERDRRAGLGCAAFLCGPLVGVGLAGLATHLGDVHPVDVNYTYYVFCVIGAIAGFMTGCASP